jgi:hypothetical protein
MCAHERACAFAYMQICVHAQEGCVHVRVYKRKEGRRDKFNKFTCSDQKIPSNDIIWDVYPNLLITYGLTCCQYLNLYNTE